MGSSPKCELHVPLNQRIRKLKENMTKPFISKEDFEEQEWTENAQIKMQYLHSTAQNIKKDLQDAF